MNVALASPIPQEPLEQLYRAYRTAYASDAVAFPADPAQIAHYIQRRLDVGHTSPLQFLDFVFSIEGISRACAQQLTRHHVGVSFSVQSQRYVRMQAVPGFVMPPLVQASSEDEEEFDITRSLAYEDYLRALDHEIPAEDARYILPLGTATNLLMKANFAALLHMCDERLCTQAQWEIRKLFAQIKNLVEGVEPLLGNLLGPKCMPSRGGVCNESYKDWLACSIGKVRPHKLLLAEWVKDWKRGMKADARSG